MEQEECLPRVTRSRARRTTLFQPDLVTNMRLRSPRAPSNSVERLLQMDLNVDAQVLDALRAVGQHYRAMCVLLSLESQVVQCAALWGQPFVYTESANLHEPRLFRTIRRQLPVVINNLTRDPAILQGVSLDRKVRSYCSAPVYTSANYLGSVDMFHSEPQDFRLKHMGYLQSSACDLGRLLEERLINSVSD